MDTTSSSNYGDCRCCLSKGHHKDIMKEYFTNGVREVYYNMFTECFNLYMSTSGSISPLICLTCIHRLRDANNFRTMVVSAERQLLAASQETLFINVGEHTEPEPEVDVKQESPVEIKVEVSDPEPEPEYDSDVPLRDHCAKKPLSAAEKQRRYVEKLKKDPQKYEEYKKRKRECYHSKKKLVKDLTPKEHYNAKIIWKLRKKKSRQSRKNMNILEEGVPSSSSINAQNIMQNNPQEIANMEKMANRKRLRQNAEKKNKNKDKKKKEADKRNFETNKEREATNSV